MHFILSSLQQTELLGKILAVELIQHQEIYLLLNGNLAVGKTTLAKSIIKNLQIKSLVTAPTFVILNKYVGLKIQVNHMDCYRLNSTENFDLYFEEFNNHINIIEWSQLIKPFLYDKKVIQVNLELTDMFIRNCKLIANFPLHKKTLENLKKIV